MFRRFNSIPGLPTKRRIVSYWVTTLIIALESIVGGVSDIMQEPVYINILLYLGYPTYFAIILGMAKVFAAVAILVPSYPRLKEWAYAGLCFQFVGAIISYIIVGSSITMLIAPFIFCAL
jgi:hypothetical protein